MLLLLLRWCLRVLCTRALMRQAVMRLATTTRGCLRNHFALSCALLDSSFEQATITVKEQ